MQTARERRAAQAAAAKQRLESDFKSRHEKEDKGQPQDDIPAEEALRREIIEDSRL